MTSCTMALHILKLSITIKKCETLHDGTQHSCDAQHMPFSITIKSVTLIKMTLSIAITKCDSQHNIAIIKCDAQHNDTQNNALSLTIPSITTLGCYTECRLFWPNVIFIKCSIFYVLSFEDKCHYAESHCAKILSIDNNDGMNQGTLSEGKGTLQLTSTLR